ncbi:hypothetical protein MO973_44120 [Paenibacillus sp. TRM 82003]|nr:hypothetical protein [Paenibacillus sp. TRM 82003]
MTKHRTKQMASLFLAATLTVAGCSANAGGLPDDECYDDDADGYCDDNGDGTRGYHYVGGRKVFYRNAGIVGDIDIDGKKKSSSGITKGVSGSKGGIGGSTSSGG